MTLQECYVKIGGDYNDILHRFMNENMVRKFVLKFPQDNNMALFESYERRIDKINGVLAQYGIESVEACREMLRRNENDGSKT